MDYKTIDLIQKGIQAGAPLISIWGEIKNKGYPDSYREVQAEFVRLSKLFREVTKP